MTTTTTPETSVSCPSSAEDFPLTCDWCKHEPATYLAVYDITAHGRTHRVQKVIGGACVKRDWDHASDIAVSPRSAWLFVLVPETPATAGPDVHELAKAVQAAWDKEFTSCANDILDYRQARVAVEAVLGLTTRRYDTGEGA
jgi:hypothetical protein